MADTASSTPPDVAGAPQSAGTQGAVSVRAQAYDRLHWRAPNIAALIFFAAAALFGLLYGLKGDTFFLRLATEALIFGGVALSVDVLLGLTGLLSLGQALYFGLGAYVSGLVLKEITPNFWLAVLSGILIGCIVGYIGGVIAIRARGVYFALITYGLAQILSKVIYNTREIDLPGKKLFVGASDGITGIPIITIPLGLVDVRADSPMGFFFVVLVVVGLIYLALVYLTTTPFGRALAGVRINERRMPFLGYRPEQLKLAAFVIAATIASTVGSLYPMLRGFVSPELMYFEASTNAIVATIIGGTGTLIGPLYGSVILVYLKSLIGTYTQHQVMVIGALFMIAVIFFPRGLVGYARDRMIARRRPTEGGGT